MGCFPVKGIEKNWVKWKKGKVSREGKKKTDEFQMQKVSDGECERA